MCIPLSEEVDCRRLARCLPLLCEVVIELVVHCLCERLYSVEREVVFSRLYLPQILGGGSLCGSPVWTSELEILLCEGGDVELGARTSKQILLFALDPLTLTLSLSLYLLCALIILLYHILACVLLQLILNSAFSSLD